MISYIRRLRCSSQAWLLAFHWLSKHNNRCQVVTHESVDCFGAESRRYAASPRLRSRSPYAKNGCVATADSQVKQTTLCFSSGSGSSKSPGARRGHEAITDAQRMFVWGGERRDERTNAWKLCSKQEMHVLDLVRREWCVYATKSKDGPPPTGHGRCAAIGRMVYSYGGIVDLKRNRLTGELYRFDTSGFAWTRVNVDGAKPASRSNCGLCAVRDQLIMIGGYVDRTSARVQEGAAWINDSSTPGCGWSNECYRFDSIRCKSSENSVTG